MDKPTRILWLARMLPVPLNAGDRIYTARLAEALARAGANVHFLGLGNPDALGLEREVLDPIVRWEVVAGAPRSAGYALLSRRPVVGAKFGTDAYHKRLADLLAGGGYDTIILDQYALSWALPLIARQTGKNPPLLVHIAHDFESEVTNSIAETFTGNPLRKLALRINAGRTARAERELASACQLFVTLTQHDADMFRKIGARGRFIVVPPGYDGPRLPERRLTSTLPRRVGVVGSYRWTAKQINLAAFIEAADPVFAAAGIELAVVGDSSEEFRDIWSKRTKATRFLGFVDDLQQFLESCRIGLVIEAVGGGFKLKVLDYVFTGTPVAALSVALGGQAREIVSHFIIEEDAASLAAAVVARIDDIDGLDAAQRAAYSAAAGRYDWDENARQMLRAINEASRHS